MKGRAAILAVGDALVFLIFAWTGRSSHHEAVGATALPAVTATAAPFLIAWFVVAPLMGAYRSAQGCTPGALLRRTALAWLIAGPLGLVLRALALQRGIPPTFAVITLLTNLVLLLAWRGLGILALTRRRDRSPTVSP